MSTQRKTVRPRIGIFGIGLGEYWPQFPGLKEQLEGYQAKVEARVGQWADVVSAGLVDSAPAALAAGDLFQRRQVDMVYCYVGTYATSSTVIPVVQIPKVPVLVLNLQPSARRWTMPTPTPKSGWRTAAPVASRNSARPSTAVISSSMSYPACWRRKRAVRNRPAAPGRRSRSGQKPRAFCAPCAAAGWVSWAIPTPGMLDMYSDFTQHQGQLGTHIEILEMCDLAQMVNAATPAAIKAKEEEALAIFDLAEDSPSDPLATRPSPDALDWAYRVAVGLDRLFQEFKSGRPYLLLSRAGWQ